MGCPAKRMAEAIRDADSRLTSQDLAALIDYLRTLSPLPEQPFRFSPAAR